MATWVSGAGEAAFEHTVLPSVLPWRSARNRARPDNARPPARPADRIPGVPRPVDATLEARVGRAIEARRQTIEELVAAAVDARLVELVDQELDRALARLAERNGNGATPAPSSSSSSSSDPPAPALPRGTSTSLCSRCGAEPRLAGRTIGRACKQADDVARRARRREHRERAAGARDGTASDAASRPADTQPAGNDTRAHSASQRAGTPNHRDPVEPTTDRGARSHRETTRATTATRSTRAPSGLRYPRADDTLDHRERRRHVDRGGTRERRRDRPARRPRLHRRPPRTRGRSPPPRSLDRLRRQRQVAASQRRRTRAAGCSSKTSRPSTTPARCDPRHARTRSAGALELE